MERNKKSIWEPDIVIQAIKDSFKRLDPRATIRNPVMFAVEIGSVITTIITIQTVIAGKGFGFELQISLWLWITVLFANFAEALAEGKGKAQADSLKKARSETFANRLLASGKTENVSALSLRKDDTVFVKEGEIIPCDGELIDGVALVDESAITGESAPVVRESGGDRSGVTGGTRVLSGNVNIRVTTEPGETFLDQMIKMVESAKRHKTPNERALEILLIGLTVLFLVVVITLHFFAHYMNIPILITVLVALLVCLMPTTIGGLLPAIGIAGMDRLLSHNVISFSGRAVEASGDVNIVLLDKTGTITLGNRLATEFIPSEGIRVGELANSALLASLSDDTPEGRSIVILAKEKIQVRGRDIRTPANSQFVQFSADTRMSGIDIMNRKIRKGAAEAIEEFVKTYGNTFPSDVKQAVQLISSEGGTPLVVADNGKVVGVIRLKDVLKQGIKERLHQLHLMGIKSIMVTGDNPLTAASIAAEAGVSDFIAQAKPEQKLEWIRKYQSEGNMVAMIGDGTNDAPALAQADVAVAMNAGTQAAREAANMIDLDSSPTKLLDIVEIGKQILITRGALTTFSVANDVSKYFAIIPAIFAITYPQLNILNIMRLSSPQSAILSAVIFNAVIIPLLIPISLKGVKYKHASAQELLISNLVVYGFGGLLLPFIIIKIIDILIVALHLA
ncbi:MAG: K(+)-transporting ATPase subunit B [Candidatus Margulisiibacteriota bacterium]|nr:MAG: potassium-transporting ATPase subunit B [Candidatus Margulisbacteria bacterium GWD2_39_127]OGI02848.1 MAG: potassium-transporting ATPase subunit B [Candidatus Margulisbacteria bacterium GWF2_38_17]OGI09629.1 MAG: potassium-transporting ATPase subunit B [Candidatus Margulisbacteria bacterium GWE2_39_32]PZM83045.1 MAG: K(+)-transporting ATPase subunit B [Candidatus Margulisiibacteriota bacterium]HAR63663.1 K(+)-transporting ATPase subunit B [Candidatus Margulisiibacteriota bacterium]